MATGGPLRRVLYEDLYLRLKRRLYLGRARQCPICQSRLRRFRPFRGRLNAKCPICGSLERHRLVWLFLQERTALFAPGGPRRMLHFAPEPALASRFSRISGLDYLSADLDDPRAGARVDIMEIPFPGDSFDLIYCSHVLEHVPDDRRAMRELRRVLRPDGLLVIQVPLLVPATFEDPAVTGPAERLKVYGHPEHLRSFGPDVADRLREAGLQVTALPAGEIADPAELLRLGIPSGLVVFSCRKESVVSGAAAP